MTMRVTVRRPAPFKVSFLPDTVTWGATATPSMVAAERGSDSRLAQEMARRIFLDVNMVAGCVFVSEGEGGRIAAPDLVLPLLWK